MHLVIYKTNPEEAASVLATFPAVVEFHTDPYKPLGWVGATTNSPEIIQREEFNNFKKSANYEILHENDDHIQMWNAFIRPPYFIVVKPH